MSSVSVSSKLVGYCKLKTVNSSIIMNAKREFGDYQTPEPFALAVCEYLKNQRRINPTVIVEPCCGTGSFIKGSLTFNAARIIGIEVNEDYCKICKDKFLDKRVQIINADIFNFNLTALAAAGDRVLVIGNPPWACSSALSALGSANVPAKSNFKGLRGIEAITGAGNFDICEYIILKMIASFRNTEAAIAMLCKTSVARNVFAQTRRARIDCACDILEFDAKKVFGISASACLLAIGLGARMIASDTCSVYSFDEPQKQRIELKFVDGKLCSNLALGSAPFLGKCCFEWRQGVKHDCSKVMELSANGASFVNGLNEPVDIEGSYVFPLVKGSMLKEAVISASSKYVIVTQKKAGEDTSHIAVDAPKTWRYLELHKEYFAKRKSAIYKGKSDFSMFGVGDYSYAPYKVAVSGFYKKPLFSLLASTDGRPFMTDDTSYFLCFPTRGAAYVAMLILNSARGRAFLSSIAFMDAKRPYTKKVLEQIDFGKILASISLLELAETEKALHLRHCVDESMLRDFLLLVETE